MIERIAILGGSSVYVPELISSLISHNLNVKEVVLLGREGEKLTIVAAFCQRLLDQSGYPTKIIAETDVATAVTGAAYVINHVRVGGMRARLRDEKVPVKFGMVGDESLGAGGIANALRTLPVVLDHMAIVNQVNPDTTVINLTNPMGIVVDAIKKYTDLNVIGVCDQPIVQIRRVAEAMSIDLDALSVSYLGLNHLGWIQDVRHKGKSCMGRVLDCVERKHDDGFDRELVSLFRMIPTRTATMVFRQDELLKRQRDCGRFRAEILQEAEQSILRLYADAHLRQIPELTRKRNAVWYELTIVPLIQAMEQRKLTELILCIPNNGAIRGLPDEGSVEVPVKVSKNRLEPRQVGGCPHFLEAQFRAVKESDRLAVKAVHHHSYECALQALAINPFVPGLDTARRFLDHVQRHENIELH